MASSTPHSRKSRKNSGSSKSGRLRIRVLFSKSRDLEQAPVFNCKDAQLSPHWEELTVLVKAMIQRVLLGAAFAALLVPIAAAQDQSSKPAAQAQQGQPDQPAATDKTPEKKHSHNSTKTERKDLHAGETDVNKDQRSLSRSSTKKAQKESAKDNRSQ